MRYECELVTEGSQRVNFRLISYRSIAPEAPRFSFGSPSTQVPQSIQTLLSTQFGAVSFEFIQIDQTSSTLYRIVFRTQWGRAQLIYSSNSNTFYSFDMIDAGFGILPLTPNDSIFSTA